MINCEVMQVVGFSVEKSSKEYKELRFVMLVYVTVEELLKVVLVVKNNYE